MTFGKRGVRVKAHNDVNGGAIHRGRANAAGGPPDYVLNYSLNDSALGAGGVFLFGWLLEPYFRGVEMDMNAIFLCMLFGIGFLGSLVVVFMGLSGKTKLRVDASGLSRDQLFGKAASDGKTSKVSRSCLSTTTRSSLRKRARRAVSPRRKS
ncbi:MAG: hypothetical protein R3C60_14460 [Parvularculaceae bacterium]